MASHGELIEVNIKRLSLAKKPDVETQMAGGKLITYQLITRKEETE